MEVWVYNLSSGTEMFMRMFKVKREHGSPQHTADLAGCQALAYSFNHMLQRNCKKQPPLLSDVKSKFMALTPSVLLLVCVLLGK